PLDILVNNAAVAPQITISQTTPEEFDRIFAINVRAPFFIIQRALPLMPDGGRIINISSGVTWFATPATVYSMTKGALNVLSRSLANSLGVRNITVNTISPGITDTDMNPSIRDKDVKAIERVAAMTALRRPGRPVDIGDVVAFFASDEARWGKRSKSTAACSWDRENNSRLSPQTKSCPESRASFVIDPK